MYISITCEESRCSDIIYKAALSCHRLSPAVTELAVTRSPSKVNKHPGSNTHKVGEGKPTMRNPWLVIFLSMQERQVPCKWRRQGGNRTLFSIFHASLGPKTSKVWTDMMSFSSELFKEWMDGGTVERSQAKLKKMTRTKLSPKGW